MGPRVGYIVVFELSRLLVGDTDGDRDNNCKTCDRGLSEWRMGVKMRESAYYAIEGGGRHMLSCRKISVRF